MSMIVSKTTLENQFAKIRSVLLSCKTIPQLNAVKEWGFVVLSNHTLPSNDPFNALRLSIQYNETMWRTIQKIYDNQYLILTNEPNSLYQGTEG